jgi:hypothetical protein
MDKWEEYKNKLGDTRPWDVINKNTQYVSGDLSSTRYAICESCPRFFKITHQCKECGCFMKIKTKIESAECPLGKW